MKWLYVLGIYLLDFAVRIHALFNKKSGLFVKGRKSQFERLESIFEKNEQPVAWFHCASLGEFEQGRPVVEAFSRQYPEYFILLTFFSPSGYEMRKNYEGADHVDYMPLDYPHFAQEFVKLVKPSFAFFIKYEFWFNHLQALEKSDCWVYSVSTILRANQRFFKPYGGFYRKILRSFDHFFVQNNSTAALLKGINIHNVSVAGDTRFDRVYEIAQKQQMNPMLQTFAQPNPVLIGGSTWEPDVKVIAHFLQENEDWKAIIAPHDVSEKMLQRHEEILGVNSIRLSQIGPGKSISQRIILVDSIGLLSSLYQYGNIAFIGGAFGKGLHNTLEAACVGLPVFFGNKNYKKFQEALDLIKEKSAFAIENGEEMVRIVRGLSKDNELQMCSNRAKKYVSKQIGASKLILKQVDNVIKTMKHE